MATDDKTVENVDGNEWIAAAGRSVDNDDPTMLRAAWSAGEAPELYRK